MYEPSFATTISEYINHDGTINEKKSYTIKGYELYTINTKCLYMEEEMLINETYYDNSTIEAKIWKIFNRKDIVSSIEYKKVEVKDPKGEIYEDKSFDRKILDNKSQSEIEDFLSKDYHKCCNNKYKKFHRKYHEYNDTTMSILHPST